MEEKWQTIIGYENYQISNLGRVKSAKRGTIRKLQTDKNGYKFIVLRKNNKHKLLLIHRLVATAFLPNPHNYLFINHLDENKSNNSVENLQWCSFSYNINYGTRNQRIAESKYKPVIKYSVNGEYLTEYKSIKHAADENGIKRSVISGCCRNIYKTGGGYKWGYKKTEAV